MLCTFFALNFFACRQRPAYDLVIQNGRIVDGTGGPLYWADIGIAGDRILFIGKLTVFEAARRIDARGHVVAPGFIDLQNYSASRLPVLRQAQPLIRQGITTVLLNVDGEMRRGAWPVAAFLHQYARRPAAVNVATLVSLETLETLAQTAGVRGAAAGEDSLQGLLDLAGTALREGAFGLSARLSAVDQNRILPLLQQVTRLGGLAMVIPDCTFINLQGALAQIGQLAETAGVPLHVGGLLKSTPGFWQHFVSEPDSPALAGLFLHLPSTALWYGELAHLLPSRRFFDRHEIQRAFDALGGASRLLIVEPSRTGARRGESLLDFAEARGLSRFRAFVEILKDKDAMVAFRAVDPAALVALYARPTALISSGGGLDALAPAADLAFPEYLRLALQTPGGPRLPAAVQKITARPAAVLNLQNRGTLTPGALADIVILDAGRIGAGPEYGQRPARPAGVIDVIVNGKLVLENGQFTGALPGRPLYFSPVALREPAISARVP